jgi:hypothetical protein
MATVATRQNMCEQHCRSGLILGLQHTPRLLITRLVQTHVSTTALVHGSETWLTSIRLRLNIRTIAMRIHRESTIVVADQIPVVAHPQLGNNANGSQMILNIQDHGLLISICFA